jgi:hypothetical protein
MYKFMYSYSGQKIIILDKDQVRFSFMEDPANTDYQAYLEWLAEGNTPELIEDVTADETQ